MRAVLCRPWGDLEALTIVTIDNPPRLNAMTRQMLAELGGVWDELERDGEAVGYRLCNSRRTP